MAMEAWKFLLRSHPLACASFYLVFSPQNEIKVRSICSRFETRNQKPSPLAGAEYRKVAIVGESFFVLLWAQVEYVGTSLWGLLKRSFQSALEDRLSLDGETLLRKNRKGARQKTRLGNTEEYRAQCKFGSKNNAIFSRRLRFWIRCAPRENGSEELFIMCIH